MTDPITLQALRLLLEHHNYMEAESSPGGYLYRRRRGAAYVSGLLRRTKTFLLSQGVPTNPVPPEADHPTTSPGPSLTVLEGGRSAKDDFVDLPSDQWSLKRGEAL